MKFLLALLSVFLLPAPDAPLLLLDKGLKKPPGVAVAFTPQLYMQRRFPVYAADVNEIATVIEKAVKAIEKGQPCQPLLLLTAAHTSLRITTRCDEIKQIDVTLITDLDETASSYSFSLIRDEMDIRTVQRKLLDLALYLAR